MGKRRYILVYECEYILSANAIRRCRPITPSIRCFNNGMVEIAIYRGFLFMLYFQVVKKLEKHYPGKQGQSVYITIQPFVFAQYVTSRFDEGRKLLRCSQGLFGFTWLFNF